MNSYGNAAIKAALLLNSGKAISPVTAWDKATTEIFGSNTSGQKKSYPKDAFLGLCEEGLIRNVSKGQYTNSKKNKEYALTAISILKSNPNQHFLLTCFGNL